MKKLNKKFIAELKLGTTITDTVLCKKLGISIPAELPADRIAATKVINNFQLQKGFAVSKLNKTLKANGVSLSQASHTNYKVVSLEIKTAKVKAQIDRLTNSLLG